MKSLLVDAIRAANADAKPDAEIELDESAKLEQAELVEEASNDGTDDVEAPIPETDGLELMQTSAGMLLAEIVDEEDAELELEQEEPRFDVTIVEETAVIEPPKPKVKQAPVAVAGDVPAFERIAFWSPAICFALAFVAAVGATSWNRISGHNDNADLQALSQQGYTGSEDQLAKPEFQASRFPFLDYRASVVPEQLVEAEAGPAPRPAIQIDVRERTPAGVTEVGEDTFTSLEAAYSAYLAGDMRRVDIERILQGRVSEARSQTETDIKLLLQRHPDSVELHTALGNLFAKQSRWPEARVAFATAEQLSSGGGQQ